MGKHDGGGGLNLGLLCFEIVYWVHITYNSWTSRPRNSPSCNGFAHDRGRARRINCFGFGITLFHDAYDLLTVKYWKNTINNTTHQKYSSKTNGKKISNILLFTVNMKDLQVRLTYTGTNVYRKNIMHKIKCNYKNITNWKLLAIKVH